MTDPTPRPPISPHPSDWPWHSSYLGRTCIIDSGMRSEITMVHGKRRLRPAWLFWFARPETASLWVSNSSLNLRMVFMNTCAVCRFEILLKLNQSLTILVNFLNEFQVCLTVFCGFEMVWNERSCFSQCFDWHMVLYYIFTGFGYNSIVLVLCVAETQYGLESSEALVFLWNAIHCFGSSSICFHTFCRPQSMRLIHFCGVSCAVFSPGRGLMNGHFAERGTISCLSSECW